MPIDTRSKPAINWDAYPASATHYEIWSYREAHPEIEEQIYEIQTLLPEMKTLPDKPHLAVSAAMEFPACFVEADLRDFILAKLLQNENAVKKVKSAMLDNAAHSGKIVAESAQQYGTEDYLGHIHFASALAVMEQGVDAAIAKYKGMDGEDPPINPYSERYAKMPITDILPKGRGK